MIADAATLLVYFGLLLLVFSVCGAVAELLLCRRGPAAPRDNGNPSGSYVRPVEGGGAAGRLRVVRPFDYQRDSADDNWGGW